MTAALTAAAAIGGKSGDGVPVQISAGPERVGFVTTGNNTSLLRNCLTGDPLVDVSGNEVYGRLTEAAGVYTLEFYYLDDAGTEVAATVDETDLCFCVPYIYPFHEWNPLKEAAFADDASGGGCTVCEQLTVTADNTLSTISGIPLTAGSVQVFVNGVHIFPPAFAVSGANNQTVTLDPTVLGYDVLAAGYCVHACYCSAA